MDIKFGRSKRVKGTSYVVVTLDGDYIGELMRDHMGSPDGECGVYEDPFWYFSPGQPEYTDCDWCGVWYIDTLAEAKDALRELLNRHHA